MSHGALAVNHVPTMGLVFKVPACNCTRPFVGAQGTHAHPRDTKYRGHTVEAFAKCSVNLIIAGQSYCCNENYLDSFIVMILTVNANSCYKKMIRREYETLSSLF